MSLSTESNAATVYPLPSAATVPEEVDRLDAQYLGIKKYLGGSLSFAPLEGTDPKAILELGSGSGSWVVQAAQTFPNAEVLAVDLSPLPPHFVNGNLKFQSFDLTEPFPLEPASYDIVHSRLCFMHLPNVEDVIIRTIQLLKPGGWLLLEDVVGDFQDEGGLGPGVAGFWKGFHAHARNKGIDPLAAASYARILLASGCFSEVNAQKAVIHVSKRNEESKIGELSATMLNSFMRGPMLSYPGTTPEIVNQCRAEIEDPTRNITFDMYFVWSRKKE